MVMNQEKAPLFFFLTCDSVDWAAGLVATAHFVEFDFFHPLEYYKAVKFTACSS